MPVFHLDEPEKSSVSGVRGAAGLLCRFRRRTVPAAAKASVTNDRSKTFQNVWKGFRPVYFFAKMSEILLTVF